MRKCGGLFAQLYLLNKLFYGVNIFSDECYDRTNMEDILENSSLLQKHFEEAWRNPHLFEYTADDH